MNDTSLRAYAMWAVASLPSTAFITAVALGVGALGMGAKTVAAFGAGDNGMFSRSTSLSPFLKPTDTTLGCLHLSHRGSMVVSSRFGDPQVLLKVSDCVNTHKAHVHVCDQSRIKLVCCSGSKMQYACTLLSERTRARTAQGNSAIRHPDDLF